MTRHFVEERKERTSDLTAPLYDSDFRGVAPIHQVQQYPPYYVQRRVRGAGNKSILPGNIIGK